jgi:hypothetical protein
MRWKTGTGIAALALLAANAVAQDTTVRYDVERNRDRDRTMVAEHNGRDWCAYNANELNFSFFGTGTVGEKTVRRPSLNRIERNGKLGAGLGVQYFFHRMLGVSVDAYSESTGDHLIDNVNADLIARFPIANTGVAPYILGGGGRQIDPLYQWTVNAGAGIEWRFSPHVGIFIDGRYVWADETKDYGLGRAGLRVGF